MLRQSWVMPCPCNCPAETHWAWHKRECARSCLKPFVQGESKPWSASRPRAVKRKSLPLILRALCSALQCLFSCNPSYSASFQPGQTSKHELQWKLECIQMLLALQNWSQIHTKKHCLTDRNMLISQKLCRFKWQCLKKPEFCFQARRKSGIATWACSSLTKCRLLLGLQHIHWWQKVEGITVQFCHLKTLLINKLLTCAIFQLSCRKVAVYCSVVYCLLTYFSFLLYSVQTAVT